jgi:glucose-6-phosphate 1-dehydrogenase
LITVMFHPVPHRSFPASVAEHWQSNHIEIMIQPNEGINIDIMAKVPGPQFRMQTVDMDFCYTDAFAEAPMPEAYETLLLDVIEGDATLFMRADQVEMAWQVIMPVLEAWAQSSEGLQSYQPGTWGPATDTVFHEG